MKRLIRSLATICLCVGFLPNGACSSVGGVQRSRAQQSYRGLKFSVAGLKEVSEHNGERAATGHELVVVSTIIDRSDFKSDFRGNECRLDRAKLYDVNDDAYNSNEQQRRITTILRDEYGRLYGDAKMNYDWSFEMPAGKRLKAFKFVFADEHVYTGGADPDEDVTSLSFDLAELEGAGGPPSKVVQVEGTIPFADEVAPPLPAGLRLEVQCSPWYVEGGTLVGNVIKIRLHGDRGCAQSDQVGRVPTP